ncbi:MAG TPA: nucleoside recognition domain-containing protein [Bacillota bacterium]|nr:nucleoside recognition domain-containing protein [Bacillota bacterium]
MDIPPRSALIKKTSSLKNFHLKWVQDAFHNGIGASISIVKVMLPVSLLIAVMKYFGFIDYLSLFLSPLFIPGEAILALLTGYLVNCYSALAVMATLPLTGKEITILSVMLVICHTLPVEMSVQKRAGGPFWVILGIRLFASLLMGWLLNLWLPGEQVAMVNAGSLGGVQDSETFAPDAVGVADG